MKKRNISYGVHFLLIIAIQFWILNKIEFPFYQNITVCILPLALIQLPIFKLDMKLMLLMAFCYGCLMDIFQHTMGIQSFSMVLMVFCQKKILAKIRYIDDVIVFFVPNIYTLNFKLFSVYAFLMNVIYHTSYVFLETLSFQNFFSDLMYAIISSVVGVFFMVLYQLIWIRNERL